MKPTITMIIAALLLTGTPAFAQNADLGADVKVRPAQVRAELRTENRAEIMEIRDEIKDEREEMREEMEETRKTNREVMEDKRVELKGETNPEVRAENREEMKEKREEMREEVSEKREERKETIREKRGDIVARLANNIVLRLESGVRKITQIAGRTQIAIDNKAGEDMSAAQAELDKATTFLAAAGADIASIKALISTWAEFDVTSDTFIQEINTQKEGLRELMKSAHENLKSASASVRIAIKAVKGNSTGESATSTEDSE